MAMHFYQIDNFLLELLSISYTAVVIIFLFYTNIKTLNNVQISAQPSPFYPLAENANVPEVHIGLIIEDFPLFDITGNSFILEGFLWFSYNADAINKKYLTAFTCRRGKVAELFEQDEYVKDGITHTFFKIRVQFSTDLYYQSFPLGNHAMHLILEYPSSILSNMSLKTTKESLAITHPRIPGWYLKVEDAYAQMDRRGHNSNVVEYPTLVFTVSCIREGTRKLFIIALPLFFAFFIGFLALTLNPEKYPQPMVTLSIASLTGLLAYRFVIERISPNVSYFTLSDHIFNIFLIHSFIAFLVMLALLEGAHRFPEYVVPLKISSIILIQISLIATFGFLIYHWKKFASTRST